MTVRLAGWPLNPIGRRTFLLGAGALVLSACSRDQERPSAEDTRPPTAQPSASATQTPGARVLLAYFSRPGENYYYGGRRDLEVGNTAVVASLIADRLNVDTYVVEAADPYPQEYQATVERNQQEQRDDARPALATAPPSLQDFDTVLIGCPVWNVRAPMIMHTLFEQLDLTGKTVLPFVTYAISGIGRVADEITDLARPATVGQSLAVQGEEAQQSGPEVDRWLTAAGLLG